MRSVIASVAGLAMAGAAQAQPAPRPATVAPPAMQAAAPGLADYTDDVLFGEVWKRPGLSPRDRSLITVSALIAAGRAPQLAGHVGRALDNGVTPLQISGIVTQMAFYEGWPVAVSAVAVIDEVFKKRGIERPAPAPAAGEGPAAPVGADLRVAAPELADLTTRVLFGDLWRRTDLSPRDRSLATVAGLIAAGDTGALPTYVQLALANGVTRAELGEAVTHLAFYAGWPRAMAAIPALQPPSGGDLVVSRAGSDPATGPADHFTGAVRVTAPFRGTGDARVRGSTVTFAPGARTNWHSHPLGQTLIVTQGTAWVQREGGPIEVLHVGDTIYIPPGVKHWHGASPSDAMSHVAITEELGGKTVDWLEPVTNAQYERKTE